jgi:glucokinase-like ROK family protein
MPNVLDRLRGQLVISCQAFPGDPMEDIETLRRVALSALRGGGGGLRLHGVEHVAAMRKKTDLPIIAIQKSYMGGQLRITPDFASAKALAEAGADIIAMDCTGRPELHGEPWQEMVLRIHEELGLPVMADIATREEGEAAAAAGVEMIGTTLHGYTRETEGAKVFNATLITDLSSATGLPVVAEGHITTPQQAARAIEAGAWCVVVGSAITRPGVIAESFAKAIAVFQPHAMRYAIGVDIGGTAVKAGIVNGRGGVSQIERVPTNAFAGRDAIIASTVEAIEKVERSVAQQRIQVEGIGVASAGAIDAERGVVFAATENLPGWAGFALGDFLTKRFSLPVHVENDAHAAVLSELHFGIGRGLKDFVAITLGTGVGGGIVQGGELQRGALGFAGTIGHHTIRFDGIACNCGRRGCLEAYVSTVALVREFRARTALQSFDGENAEIALRVAQLAAEGNAAAIGAYGALADYLAEGVANIFNLFDPQAVILSGGLVESYDGFMERVSRRTEQLLHFGEKRKPTILKSAAGHMAGVQGAASAFLR